MDIILSKWRILCTHNKSCIHSSYLFGCTRVPRKNCDEMKQHLDSKHIVVIRLKESICVLVPLCVISSLHFRKGQFFKVTVLDHNGKLTTPGQLKKVFKHIIDTVGGM